MSCLFGQVQVMSICMILAELPLIKGSQIQHQIFVFMLGYVITLLSLDAKFLQHSELAVFFFFLSNSQS